MARVLNLLVAKMESYLLYKYKSKSQAMKEEKTKKNYRLRKRDKAKIYFSQLGALRP